MFEYENLTVSKLSLVLKTGCYSQREFMFTFQKYFFFLELKRILCMCVLQKEKKNCHAPPPPPTPSLRLFCVTLNRDIPFCAHIFLGKFFLLFFFVL